MADYYVSTSGDDSTGDGSSGNPYATPGKALAVAVAAASAGFNIYVKADGTYTTTTNTSNVAGGRLNFSLTGSQTAFNRLIGYTTTITDGGRFTLALGSGLSGPLITLNNANSYNDVANVNLVGNSTSGATAAALSGRSNRLRAFKVSGFSGGGSSLVTVTSNVSISDFEISGGSTANFAALSVSANGGIGQIVDGWIHGNAGRGVDVGDGSCTLARVRSCDHSSSNGWGFFNQSAGELVLIDCVAWGNAKSNFMLFGSNSTMICDGCVSGASSEYDWDNASGIDAVALYNCAGKTSSSGLYPATPNIRTNFQTLTGVPFTDYANGDFSTNNTAGAGAALRGIVRALGATTTYRDIGVAQHQDSGGGGSGGVSRAMQVNCT